MAKHFPDNKNNQFFGKYTVLAQHRSVNTKRKDLSCTKTMYLAKKKKSRHFGLNLMDIPHLWTTLMFFSPFHNANNSAILSYLPLYRKPSIISWYLLMNKNTSDIIFAHNPLHLHVRSTSLLVGQVVYFLSILKKN